MIAPLIPHTMCVFCQIIYQLRNFSSSAHADSREIDHKHLYDVLGLWLGWPAVADRLCWVTYFLVHNLGRSKCMHAHVCRAQQFCLKNCLQKCPWPVFAHRKLLLTPTLIHGKADTSYLICLPTYVMLMSYLCHTLSLKGLRTMYKVHCLK